MNPPGSGTVRVSARSLMKFAGPIGPSIGTTSGLHQTRSQAVRSSGLPAFTFWYAVLHTGHAPLAARFLDALSRRKFPPEYSARPESSIPLASLNDERSPTVRVGRLGPKTWFASIT